MVNVLWPFCVLSSKSSFLSLPYWPTLCYWWELARFMESHGIQLFHNRSCLFCFKSEPLPSGIYISAKTRPAYLSQGRYMYNTRAKHKSKSIYFLKVLLYRLIIVRRQLWRKICHHYDLFLPRIFLHSKFTILVTNSTYYVYHLYNVSLF